jgi:hypothetical protein
MKSIKYDWVKLGALAGILGIVSYFGIQIPVIPEKLARILAFSFGPWLIIWAIGIYIFLSLDKKSVSAQVGTLFIAISGVTVNFMLVVQQSIFTVMNGYWKEATDPVAKETLRWVWRGLNSIHYGLDISFDIFIMVGVVVVSFAMMSHPKFGKVFAIPGMLVGGSALFINMYTFPTPPGSAEGTFIDLGPFIGLWGLAVAIQMFRSFKWAKAKTTSSEASLQLVV